MEKHELNIEVNNVTLPGELVLPYRSRGLIIFSHGSGSSRFSPRNNMVAEKLREKRFGTFLFDLLSKEEDEIYENRFDIKLLSERLVYVTRWLMTREYELGRGIGYFGASTGAASALHAAAELGNKIQAIVLRGGRPDLALPVLDKITAPTLFLVGELDIPVLHVNQVAHETIKAPKEFKIIPGATHLFEEPGKLEEVAEAAGKWYQKYIP